MSREMADIITCASIGVDKFRAKLGRVGRILASPIEMASHPYNSYALSECNDSKACIVAPRP